jgi:hypothetical protein
MRVVARGELIQWQATNNRCERAITAVCNYDCAAALTPALVALPFWTASFRLIAS